MQGSLFPDSYKTDAVFSDDERYRFKLYRQWAAYKPNLLFVMLNPSTATAETLDPTCTRCQVYAQDWGFGGFYVGNCFAIRGTDPKVITETSDPIGDGNDASILEMAADSDLVVCAWGNHAEHLDRGRAVWKLLNDAGHTPHALTITDSGGHPGHPLYLRGDLKPFAFSYK